MSTRTYTTQLRKGPGAGHQIALKLKKDLADRVVSELEKALDLGSGAHWRELAGVLGVNEHESILWAPFGAENHLADPDKYTSDCAAFLAGLPDPIDESNYRTVVLAARKIFDEHLPIVDNRTAPEVHAQEVAERAALQAARDEENRQAREARAALYAEGTEPIPTPDGQVPVTIQLQYDNSDGMSDYYDPNASHGEKYLLGFVREGSPRTEKNHRALVARFPDLAGLTWTWKDGIYNSRWLESEPVTTLEDVKTYAGYENPPAWWAVEVGSTKFDRDLLPFKGYAAAHAPSTASTPAQDAPSTSSTVTAGAVPVQVTHERDWTWIVFDHKPDEGTLEKIRPHAQFSRRRCAWYITSHVEPEQIAAWLG